MHIAIVKIKGVSPYSQSRPHITPHLDKEAAQDYERRTWRERIHADQSGEVFIPNTAFKNSLSEAAKFLGMPVKGKGKNLYTKHFEAGIVVAAPMMLGIKKEDVAGEWLFLPSDGKRGGGKRVWKCYPVIQEWGGTVAYHVLDDTITEPVFTEHVEQDGQFIGLGRFRPRNNGFYGRFKVEGIEWR